MIKYCVYGLGYDKNDCITDYEHSFGYFYSYEKAYELFVRLQCGHWELFFIEEPNLSKLLLQLEECEETEDEINCIDVKNEWWITNPNFKEK